MRIVFAVLLVCAGLFILWPPAMEAWYSWITIPVGIVALLMARRTLVWIGMLLALILIPQSVRLYGKHRLTFLGNWFGQAWHNLDWRIRVGITILPFVILALPIFAAGGVLGLIAAVGPAITGNTAIAVWIRLVLVPFLARKAAGVGMGRLFPPFWDALPKERRKEFAERYRHLWWWTMRKMIKRRKILSRRAITLAKRNFEGFRVNPLP